MFETMVIQQALIDHIKEELTTIQEFQLSKTLSSTMNGQSVGGSQFIVGLQESEMNAEKCIVHVDRKSTRLNSSHVSQSRMPSSA